MTNKTFAQTDGTFKEACSEAGIPNTARQASKYKRGMGLAFKKREATNHSRKLDANKVS